MGGGAAIGSAPPSRDGPAGDHEEEDRGEGRCCFGVLSYPLPESPSP